MSHVTELSRYQYKAQLELCLALIEEAHQWATDEYHDMVKEQLADILQLFDRLPMDSINQPNHITPPNNMLYFPLPPHNRTRSQPLSHYRPYCIKDNLC